MTMRRLLVSALTLSLAGSISCASGSQATRVIQGGVTVRVAPRLDSLPRDATYAWVSPDSLFGKLTPLDLERSDEPGLDGMRRDLDVVFGAHGWRRAEPSAAQYLVALAFIDRRPPSTVARVTNSQGSCRQMPNGQQACAGSRPQNSFDTRLSERPVQGPWMMRSIRRRADGAETVRVLGLLSFDIASRTLADETVRLFLGDERAR